MCAAVAGAVKPVNVSSIFNILPLRVKMPTPVPELPVGGTSLDPKRTALYMESAWAGMTRARARTKDPVRTRRLNIVLLPRWGGNRLDGIEYGQLPGSQNRLTKGSCAIEEHHSFFKPAMKRLIWRDSSGCIAEPRKQSPE